MVQVILRELVHEGTCQIARSGRSVHYSIQE
jgi:hypothetical protein